MEIIVNIGVREDGKHIAASASSPYFCFEADSEVSLKQKVESAVAFYEKAKEAEKNKPAPRSETITITRIRPVTRLRTPIREYA